MNTQNNIVKKINDLVRSGKKISVLTKDGWSESAVPVAALTSERSDYHEGIRLAIVDKQGFEVDRQIFMLNEILDVKGIDWTTQTKSSTTRSEFQNGKSYL